MTMSSSAERVPAGTLLRSADAVPFQPRHAETAPPRSSRESARAEGYSTGWAQGIREARAATAGARERTTAELDRVLNDRDERARQALTALVAAAGQVRATTVQRIDEVLDATLTAAVELAEALAGAALATDLVEGARQGLRRVLAEVPAAVPVTVRLNPADLAELEGAEKLAPGMDVTLVADAAVERGGAVASTAVTTVDATLSAAVRRVRAELDR
jgi:flagellar assembly protein FliH